MQLNAFKVENTLDDRHVTCRNEARRRQLLREQLSEQDVTMNYLES